MERDVKRLSELDDKILWDESPEYLGKSFLLEFNNEFYMKPGYVEDIIKPIVERNEGSIADMVERHLLEAVQWLSNNGLLAEYPRRNRDGSKFFITRRGHRCLEPGTRMVFKQ